jgi:ATP-binding cassette subfamily F protein 3
MPSGFFDGDIMLLLSDISKQYAGQAILKHVTIPLSKKRTALVGMNGSGKSTLMKIIAGIEYADNGDITTKRNTLIEYLPQQAVYDFKGTVYEEVSAWLNSDRFNELSAREAQIIKILENDSNPDDSLCEELAEVVEELHTLDVKKKRKNSVETILLNLGFAKEDWNRHAKTLSGGWQMRIALARVLVREPDIVLLDEPTNYLDIATIDFLADWMLKFDGQVLLVSHDRDFLNRVVEETWEVFAGNVSVYRGNYDFYLVEKEQRLKVLEKQREKQLDEIKVLNDFYEKNRFNAATAPLAQSKYKQMEKLKAELITLPRTPSKMNFRLPDPKRGGEIVTEVDKLYHSFGDIDVIANYKRIISRRERIALVGRNGFGKSTLMNIIGGEIEPLSGECRLGKDVEVSYFRQHEITLLPSDMSVLQFVESIAPFDMMSRVKTLLGSFLFYEDDWDKRIGVLSGGEKVRIAFIKMIMNPGNLLLLDEPTTHLDIDSKEILLRTLKNIDATIIFVSHDSYFINSLATSVVYFRKRCDIINFPGTYSEYLERYGHDIIDEETLKNENADIPLSKGKMDFTQQKEIRNKINRLKKEIESIQKDISNFETEKSTLTNRLNSGSGSQTEMSKKISEIESKLLKLMEEWAEKTEALEKLES